MQGELIDESDMEAGFDGECDECHQFDGNLVELPTANVYLCSACLSVGRMVADRW
jgi:late competence protein required for DNA uptake (superfamily II DNA/RNA helicase)